MLEALRIDDTIAEAHGELGAILGVSEFDWHGAEQEFRRALELNPSSADVQYYYSNWFLQPLGRAEQALSEMRRLVELNPLGPGWQTSMGYCLHATRQFEQAVEQHRRAIELDPTWYLPFWYLSLTCALIGRRAEAIAAAEKANELSGGTAPTMGLLGRTYGMAGRKIEARQLLDELEVRRRTSYVPCSSIAMIHRGLGDLEKALEWWARGIEEHDMLLVLSLKAEPGYDSMRSHPAYHTLLRKMNLEP